MNLVAIKEKSLELKKHVGLIHSTNKLSLLERKIANALLYNAYDDLLKKNEHQIHIPALCRLIGYNSKDDKTIKKSLMSLISTALEWNLIDQGEKPEDGVWMASSMLADAKIEGTMCTYSYSNRMRELCYYPEFYGRLDLKVLAVFKSTYGLALYENCIRFQNISQTPWFDIPTFKKLMGVTGGKYAIFRDLNSRVIKPAVKEVNQYSPLFVDPEVKKQGRVVVAIRFLLHREIAKKVSRDTSNYSSDNDSKNKNLEMRLLDDYGLSSNQASSVIKKYEENYISEKMDFIESSKSYQSGNIKNLSKYLQNALLNNYKPPKSSQENVVKIIKKTEQEKRLKEIHQKNINDYKKYLNESLPKVYEKLNSKDKKRVLKGFDEHIATTVYQSVYSKYGIDNPLVTEHFSNYLRSNYSKLMESLFSFEEFCKKKNNGS